MTPEQHGENEPELDGKKLIDFIASDDPAEAFLKWLEKTNPELAQEIRDEEADKP